MSQQLLKLLKDEDGTSFVEFTLFVGFLFLAGAGFLYFSASQFKDAFMSPKQMQF
jgi:Flp pilus assembly pilin Flp